MQRKIVLFINGNEKHGNSPCHFHEGEIVLATLLKPSGHGHLGCLLLANANKMFCFVFLWQILEMSCICFEGD